MRFKDLIIKLFTPTIWKYNQARQVGALTEFSQIEFDSGRQILGCLQKIESKKIKGYLFQHVLEEYFHADLFADVAKSESDSYLNTIVLKKRELLPKNASQKEVVDCFAYIHIGEKVVNEDFKTYAKIDVKNKIKAVFSRAGADEDQHEKDTGDILQDMVTEKKMNYTWTVVKAKSKHIWYSYTQTMTGVGKIPLFILLNLTYFLFGWIGRAQAVSRLKMNKDEQLKIFTSEIEDFERQFKI